MKLSGLGLVPIGEPKGTLFPTTSRWRSQESNAALMKKAIKVETESITRKANSHRFCDATHPTECFAIRVFGVVYCEWSPRRHFRVSIWGCCDRWFWYIWLGVIADTCKHKEEETLSERLLAWFKNGFVILAALISKG